MRGRQRIVILQHTHILAKTKWERGQKFSYRAPLSLLSLHPLSLFAFVIFSFARARVRERKAFCVPRFDVQFDICNGFLSPPSLSQTCQVVHLHTIANERTQKGEIARLGIFAPFMFVKGFPLSRARMQHQTNGAGCWKKGFFCFPSENDCSTFCAAITPGHKSTLLIVSSRLFLLL